MVAKFGWPRGNLEQCRGDLELPEVDGPLRRVGILVSLVDFVVKVADGLGLGPLVFSSAARTVDENMAREAAVET